MYDEKPVTVYSVNNFKRHSEAKLGRKGQQRQQFRSGPKNYAYPSKCPVSVSDLGAGRLSMQNTAH